MPQDNLLQKHKPIPVLNGFQKPNEIITPNQFFDVCLPYHSTQVIRVVAFILRETLGYTNDDGDPFQERFRFSYQAIAEGADVSPSAVKKALDDAVKARFLNRVRQAVVSSKGQAAMPAEYELRWHDYQDGAYVVDPHKFKGFFAAEGNRTNIPDEFFTHVVRHNTKSVIRFVGAVIRHTLGIKASHGKGRVKRAKLSYRQLQHYLKLTSRSLSSAIKKAMALNYVVRLEEGVFDSKHPENNREAIYTVKWCEHPHAIPNLSTPRSTANDHTKKYSEPTPKNTAAFHTKKYGLLKRFTNVNLNKQQDSCVVVENSFLSENQEPVSWLIKAGFSKRDALKLAEKHAPEAIRQQITWLPERHPRHPLGMLRSAIEESWAAPTKSDSIDAGPTSPEASAFARGFYAGRWEREDAASDPSQRDLVAAERVVHQLAKIHGTRDPDHALTWGRGFGRHYGREYPKLVPSLAFAARVLVDDLLRSHQRQAESARIRKQLDLANALSNDESEPDKRAWLDHLASVEPTLKEHFPDTYAAFEQGRAQQRTNFQRSGLPQFAERMSAQLDRRSVRLSNLQRAFPDHLPDFETWKIQQASSATLSTNT